MAKLVSRKIFLFGRYSGAVLIPKKWLSKAGVEIGDSVELKYNSSKKRIDIHLTDSQTKPSGPKDTKSPENRSDNLGAKSDFEPIPSL